MKHAISNACRHAGAVRLHRAHFPRECLAVVPEIFSVALDEAARPQRGRE